MNRVNNGDISTMTTNQQDDEWTEEDTMVVVELSGILDEDFITKGSGDCKVLGIDTDKPMLQLDRYTFTGHYEDTIGTNLIFSQHPITDRKTSLLDTAGIQKEPCSTGLDFCCKVDKKLVMSRVFISKNQDDTVDEALPGPSGDAEVSVMCETKTNTDSTSTKADIGPTSGSNIPDPNEPMDTTEPQWTKNTTSTPEEPNG